MVTTLGRQGRESNNSEDSKSSAGCGSSSSRCGKWASHRGEASSLNALCIVPTSGANLISASASGLLLFSKWENVVMTIDTTPHFYKVVLETMEIWFFGCFHGNSPLGKSTGSVEQTYGVRCASPGSSQKYLAAPQKNWCHTKPTTCTWPLPVLCRGELGTSVWLCQPSGFQIESKGQVPSTLNSQASLGYGWGLETGQDPFSATLTSPYLNSLPLVM